MTSRTLPQKNAIENIERSIIPERELCIQFGSCEFKLPVRPPCSRQFYI